MVNDKIIDTVRQKASRVILDELLEVDRGLTSWEMDFIRGVYESADFLTPAQMDKIDSIYGRLL